jgi:hypothetical protein
LGNFLYIVQRFLLNSFSLFNYIRMVVFASQVSPQKNYQFHHAIFVIRGDQWGESLAIGELISALLLQVAGGTEGTALFIGLQ